LAALSVSRDSSAAKAWHRMDYSDTLDLARNSKYGKSLTWDDPRMRAGYAEVQRRRHRGE
jgi:hypothetical protein